jgi:hypothetical protein
MRPEDILKFVQRRPFQPFRLTTTGGESFDVYHPELALVGRSVMAVGVDATDKPVLVADGVVTLALVHIVKTEPLQMGSPSSSNGQERTP